MSAPAELTVPDLYCPFPSAIHADAQSLEAGTLAWMQRYGYITTAEEERSAHDSQFGTLAARTYPAGRSEVIQLASDLMTWLFLTDDANIEEPGHTDTLPVTASHILHSVRILHDPDDLPPAPTHHHRALQDISNRVRALATEEQRDRLIGGMVEYFMAGACEAIYLCRKITPPVDDYIALRDSSIATRSVCFLFSEIAGNYQLPGPLWCHPGLQSAVRLATRIISNHHDILSGLREQSREVPMNLPWALSQERELSTVDAIAQTAAFANADTRRFVQLADILHAGHPSRAVELYIAGLKAWIRGNLDWSLTTGRFHVSDYVVKGDVNVRL
ncbi:hypothetical protein ACFQ7F_44040 [Streptomyces sp. NPDC056486]|uniref:terpene synthase family protein n=1 Tax=Streptomyces sp. NPDC056486 TaxID=3345835 RepID=UPI0036B534D3